MALERRQLAVNGDGSGISGAIAIIAFPLRQLEPLARQELPRQPSKRTSRSDRGEEEQAQQLPGRPEPIERSHDDYRRVCLACTTTI